jgi:hypothetical protein
MNPAPPVTTTRRICGVSIFPYLLDFDIIETTTCRDRPSIANDMQRADLEMLHTVLPASKVTLLAVAGSIDLLFSEMGL